MTDQSPTRNEKNMLKTDLQEGGHDCGNFTKDIKSMQRDKSD